MNHSYKVIWNRSLNCFMAVAEYAKSRGKSSGSVVSSASSASAAVSSGTRLLRLSSLTVALAATGMTLSPQVFAASYEAGGGTATGTDAIAIGNLATTGTTTTNGQSIAIGAETKATGDQSVALGANVVASGNSSVAVGGDDVDKIANNATQAAQYTAITGGTLTAGNYTPTTASGAGASAFGVKSVASGNFSSAIGMTSSATGAASVALGVSSNAAGQGALAIGAVSTASNTGSVAVGINSRSTGENAIAIGSGNTATTGANAVGASSVAIGANANASVANSVALGAGSTTTAPTGNAFLTNVAAVPANGVVSVGSATVTRRIQNVAGGSAPTDAVNVAQLTQQNTLTNKQGVDTAAALGATATYNPATGAISAPAYSLNNGTVTANNVGAAITNIDGRTTTNTTNIAGNTSNIANLQNQTFRLRANGDTATAVASGDTVTFLDGNNVNITRTGNNVTIGTSLTPTFATVTSTGALTAGSLSTSGALTVAGVSKLNGGANLNNQKIINVANGNVDANSQEAINGRQLLSTAESVKNVIGGTAVNTAGIITATNIGGTGANTIDGAITNVRDAATIAKTTVTEGKNVTVTASTNKDGSTNYNVRTNDDLALTSVTTGNTVLNNAGVTITGGSKNTVSLSGTGLDNGGNRITRVDNGIAADDAATFGQLTTTNVAVTDNTNRSTGNLAALGGNAAYDAANNTYTAPTYTLNNGNNNADTTDFNTVGGALSNLDGRTTTNTTNIANVQAQANEGINLGNGTTSNKFALGDTINVRGDNNLTSTTTADGVQVSLNKQVDLGATGSITTGNTITNNTGVRIDSAGRSNISTVDYNYIYNSVGSYNLSTANENIIRNGANVTRTSATGTSVNDGTNSSNYGANGLTATDGTNTTTLNKTGLSFTDANGATGPSVTATGISAGNQVLTNVGAGSITAVSKDAINGSQLFDSAESVKNVIGGTAVNTAGIVTATNIGGTGESTIDGAITNVRDAATKAKTTVTEGKNVTVTSSTNKDGSTNYNVRTRDDLALTSVTTGDSVLNNAGLTITGGPRVTKTGINAANTKITGVAAGTAATDAVNFGQLTTAGTAVNNKINALGISTAANLGGGAKYNTATGTVSDPVYTLDDGTNTGANVTADNVGGALDNLNTRTTTNTGDIADLAAGKTGLVRQDAGTGIITVGATTAGTVVDFTNSTGTTRQLTGVASAGDYTAAGNTNNAVNAGDLNTAVNSVTDLGLSFAGDSGKNVQRKLGETLSVTGGADTTTLTDNNIGVVTNDTNGLVVKLNKDIDLGADGSLKTGNTVTNNTGVTITDGANITEVTSAGTKVTEGTNISKYGANGFTATDGNGNTGRYSARGTLLSDDSGNVNANSARGNAISDSTGNVNLSGARGNAIFDNQGNISLSGARGNILLDNAGNRTTTSASGTTVTDNNGNTGNYSANGLSATDAAGNSTIVNQAGVSFTNDTGIATGPSITAAGINAGNSTISNVADGVADNDVATLGQLTAANKAADTKTNALGTSTADNLGGGAKYNEVTGAINAPTYTLDDGTNTGTNVTANNVGGALDNLNTRTTTNTSNIANVQAQANKGFNISAAGGKANNVQLGETVDFTNTDNNLVVTNTGNTINYNLAENINLGANGSLTTGNTVTNNDGVRIDDGNGNITTVTTAGTKVTDSFGNTGRYSARGTLLSDDSGNVNANSARGNAISDSSGNVNLSGAIGNALFDSAGNANLSGAEGSVVFDNAGNRTITSATGTNVTDGTNTSNYSANGLSATDATGNSTIVNQAGVSFIDANGATGPSITAAGINAGNSTISNVADGVAATDVATLGQLTAANKAADIKTNVLGTSTADNLGGGAKYNEVTGAVSAPIYELNNGNNNADTTVFNNVGSALSNLDTRATTNTSDIAKGINFGNGVTNNKFALGDTINVKGGDNLTSTTTADGVQVTLNKQIDLGTTGNIKTGNTSVNNAGITILNGPVDTVVLGRNGLNNGGNRITNLAEGIAADDAATFGQVTSVNNKVNALGASTETNLGGGATYNTKTGAVSAPTYTLDNGANTGTTADFNNVGSALKNLDGRTTTNTSNIADLTAGKIGLVRQDNGTGVITVGATTSGTVVDFTNSTGASRQLTGVASAGDYTVAGNANNAVNAGDLNAAVGNIENTVTDKGLTFASDRGVNVKRKLGETLSITGGETDAAALASGKNIGVSTNATNDGLVVQLAKDIDLGAAGSIKTGNTITNNTGVTISDGANVTTVKATGTNVTDGTNTSNYDANGLTIAGGPSITTAGINAAGNKVSNIANGTDAGDAVNLGQLTAASASADAKTDALGASTANNLGGGAIYNTKTGTVSEPTYTLNDGTNTGTNTTVNNVGSALSNLDGRTTTNTTDIAKGIKINVDGGERTYALGETIGITTDSNIITTATKDGVNIAINPELALTSVTTGNSVLNNTGLTIAGGPSITTAGINAAGNKVSNIANATAAGDAVNLGQLTAANATADAKTDALGASTANNLGGGAAYNTKNGSVSAPAYKLDDGSNTGTNVTANNVGGALDNLNTRTTTNTGDIANVQAQANKGFNISAAGGKANNVQLGDTVDFTNTDGNLIATASGNAINYNLAKNIDLGTTGTLKTGNTVTNNAGVRVDDGNGNVTAVTAAGTSVTNGSNTSNYGANGFTIVGGPSVTTVGINAGNRTITNLADGVAATDAATKGQVDAVSNGLTNLTAGAVQYSRNSGNINYDNVVFAGTQAIIDQDEDGNDFVVSGGTRLSNVANGISAADAVNKGQLDSLIARNVTNVEVKDQNGNPITVNITDQVVNRNKDNANMDSLFLTYNVEGQNVTDHLTISETVQKMNTEGVKFAHTNAVNAKGDLGVTNDSSAGGNNSTAIGVNAIVREGADSTIALGHNTEASANATNSVVIGKNSQVSGQSAIAIGDGAQARGNQSISIGTGNIVNGNNSGAFGDPSIINGNNSYSVGNNNTINSNDTFVFGNNITSTVEGSVVLGTGSAARTGAGVAGYLAAGNAAVRATTSTTGSVAVGDAASGVYRQVTGVAAGTADSDAVNVSQLKAVSDTLRNNNTALSNTAVQYDKNADGTTNKGSITLGGGAAGTTITNVKAGNVSAGSTDAINGSQLHNLGSNVAGIIGGNATLDAAGNLTASNIGGTGKGNINDAIAAVNQGNAQANAGIQANSESIKANTGRLDAGLSFGADSGATINKPIGDTTALKFEGGNNITTTATSSGIKFDLNGNIDVDNITADTVTTGNTTVSNSGVTIKDGPSMTTEGINAGNKTITGVADGIKVNDAVNLGQLTALDNKLSNSVNELGYKINEVEDDANAGISAAMAMSSLPQAYIPGKSMIGGGVATYNGQSAVAIGVSKVSDNGRWVIKANGTADTQGNAGGAIGAGFHF